jgi:predicted dehydrogenase
MNGRTIAAMVRVVLLGCGFMGRMHANVYGLLPDAELVAVVDRDPEKAAAFGNEYGVPSFTDYRSCPVEHDVVDVCLPTHLHARATIEAAQGGKHVFCEKPMALTLPEADSMIEACSQAGVQLLIGHCIRFWPEYACLKGLVEDGTLGRLLSLTLVRFGEFPHWSSENWLADESKSGGGVLDMHIHDTDFALFLLGAPLEVAAYGVVDGRGPSYTYTMLRYPSTVVLSEGGWNLPTHTPFRMAFRAVFERGAALMDGGPLTVYRPDQEPQVVEFEQIKAEGGGNISSLGGYFLELKEFVDCVATGRRCTTVTPQSSRESLATVLEEIRQIKSRSSLSVSA